MDEEANVEISPSSRVDTRVHPNREVVEQIAQLLAEARSPLIICGDGVAESGGQTELVQLAETIGAPVYWAFSAELPFPSAHPLYAGLLNVVSAPALRAQLAPADVILAIGAPVLPLLFPLDESPFPRTVQLIHIDANSWEIGKNWPADIGVVADPRLAMMDILAKLKTNMTSDHQEAVQQRTAAVQAMAGQLMQALDGAARTRWDNIPISAGRMMNELGEAMLPGTVIFDEAVTSGGYLMRYLRFAETSSHYRAAGGGLGPGMPNPIGIKLARPDRPVLSVVGDGAALYTIQALWTAAHHKIPVTWVIANNASYRILKLNMLEYLGEGAAGRRFMSMDMTDPPLDFSRLAAAFGVNGVRIEHPDEIGDAVREAQISDEPRLIDVAIDGDVRSRWL
jgi:benzoylformate decarboxylase